MLRKVTPPKCADCGTGTHLHPYPRGGNPEHGHEWLCGSCKVLRDNPDAPRRVLMPSERRVPKQRERLFEL